MSLLSRFLGGGKKQAGSRAEDGKPVAQEQPNKASLQVVFAGPLKVPATALAGKLRQFDTSMQHATCEFEPTLDHVGLVAWGNHVVRMLGVNRPVPAQPLETCVGPAHYAQDIKQKVRLGQSHMLLWYIGSPDTPMREQFVALASLAETLADFGAIAILNETAHTSLPSGIFKKAPAGERLELLRSMPLTMLYCGFVKYEVEGTKGVWMRTYGAQKFGLPDFAALAEGHHQGSLYSGLFDNTWDYMLESGAPMDADHTMQIGEDNYLKLREPAQSEYFLHGPGKVLVASVIGAHEVNSRVFPAG